MGFDEGAKMGNACTMYMPLHGLLYEIIMLVSAVLDNDIVHIYVQAYTYLIVIFIFLESIFSTVVRKG